jgi:hypothetical protein
MDQKKTHWTEDPEILERYIMGRLSPPEKAELDSHIRLCERCRLAILAEQHLLAGIRRTGREEMKSKLKQRIVEAEAVGASRWIPILSAAAAIVTLIGIGIYADWFGGRDRGEPMIVTPPVTEESLKDAHAEEKKEHSQPERIPSEERVSRDDRQRQELPSIAGEGGGAADREADVAKFEEVSSTGFWITGTQLAEESDSRIVAKTRKAPASEKKDSPIESKVQQRRITVEQQPTRLLPAEKQTGVGSVQALVERTEDGLHFIVYVDSLGKEPLAIIAEQIAEDSVIMKIGEKRFGFRLPDGQDDHVPAKGR